MIEQILGYIYNLPGGHLTLALALLAFFGFVFYSVYRIVFYTLKQAASKTTNTFDDVLFERMQDPAMLLVITSTLYVAVGTSYPDQSFFGIPLYKVYFLLLIVNTAFALERFLTTFLEWYKKEVAPKTGSQLDDELIPILEKILNVAIYIAALIMLLDNLGVQITPLLAGLGIASLAVALALQDSLGNFIAGVNISVDRPMRKGDYISTDGGIEGAVQEVGWRSTRILNPNNNLIVIPNTRLAQGVITNYHKPDEKVLLTADVGVSYGDDPDAVIKAVKDAIKAAAQNSSALVPGQEPLVRLLSFGDFALNFRFVFEAKNYGLRFAATDEANRAIFYEFKRQGIRIPFPVRVIYNYPPSGEPKRQEEGKQASGQSPKPEAEIEFPPADEAEPEHGEEPEEEPEEVPAKEPEPEKETPDAAPEDDDSEIESPEAENGGREAEIEKEEPKPEEKPVEFRKLWFPRPERIEFESQPETREEPEEKTDETAGESIDAGRTERKTGKLALEKVLEKLKKGAEERKAKGKKKARKK